MKTGFIGLGAMGAPMARHLHARGLLTVVGNRTQDKADALAAELGVRAARSADNFADCDVVVLCVSLDIDLIENANALADVLKRGALVIDHTTVAVESARRAAAALAAHDIAFVDAPVSGGVEGARNGKLSVMAGGDADAVERARAVLDCYAARVTHMGPTGAGQATKAVNQVLVAGINEAVCEGLALAEKLGLDPALLLPTLTAGAANSWFLEKRGATMLRDEFAVGFKLALLHKDLRIVEGMAREAGLRATVIPQSLADYAALMAEGHGDDDISGLIRRKRAPR